MTKNKLLIGTVVLAAAICGPVLYAQAPVVNIDPHRHGNLAAAQNYIVQAYQRIDRAQRENNDELRGHAQKAKDFLTQADAELRLAADVANENRH